VKSQQETRNAKRSLRQRKRDNTTPGRGIVLPAPANDHDELAPVDLVDGGRGVTGGGLSAQSNRDLLIATMRVADRQFAVISCYPYDVSSSQGPSGIPGQWRRDHDHN